MEKERLEVLEQVISYWEVDVENGIITTPKGSHGALHRGRLMTTVIFNGRQYTYFVHQIIAFVGGLDLLDKDVNHIDGDKLNNKISNLECITRLENLKHARDNNLIPSIKGEGHHNTKLVEEDVLNIRRLHDEGYSQKKLSEMYGVHISGINRIVKRINWKHI